jgi:uncharacterized glyoxalase superfamily protein PhnB
MAHTGAGARRCSDHLSGGGGTIGWSSTSALLRAFFQDSLGGCGHHERMTAYACLRYRDADAALDFLRSAFGFEAEQVHRGASGRIEHAEVRAGFSLIMVGEHRGPGPYARMLGRGWTYVAVPEVDDLCARARAAGAEITMELTDQPHGSRDFSALDPDGNQWNFGTYQP